MTMASALSKWTIYTSRNCFIRPSTCLEASLSYKYSYRLLLKALSYLISAPYIYMKGWIQVQNFKVYLRNNKNIVIIISRFVILALDWANFSGLRFTSVGCQCRSFALSWILHVIKTLVWYLPLFFWYPPMLEMTNTIKYLTCDRPISYKKLSNI